MELLGEERPPKMLGVLFADSNRAHRHTGMCVVRMCMRAWVRALAQLY
jgi:hypothetical protein